MMAYYFGFLPSDALNAAIDEANTLIKDKPISTTERYDQHRNKITQLIKSELLDIMLVKLIDILPNESDRKPQLLKIAKTIETTTDKLLDSILGKASNDDVMPSFNFLQQNTLFIDNEGKRRVGFLLTDSLGDGINNVFLAIKQTNLENQRTNDYPTSHEVTQVTPADPAQVAEMSKRLSELTQVTLQHYLVDFTQTLHLGMLKRAAIPVAHSVINKGADVAINRLLPQMPQEGLGRIADYYSPLIVKKA